MSVCSKECSVVARTIFFLALSALMTALCTSADAQQAKKIPLIGYLGNTVTGPDRAITPLRERLRELGYIEGQNITFEERYWEGTVERLSKLAAELVHLNCDVIFTTGNEAARAAKVATQKIPIVIANTSDAVGSGFVESLARPGGNVTGLTSVGAEIRGKQLEVLKEVFPKVSRVGFLWSPTSPTATDNLKAIQAAAQSLQITIESLEAKRPDDIEAAFQMAMNKRAEAIHIDGGGFFAFHQRRVIDAARKSRLPTMHPNDRFVEAGGLMTYANDRNEQYRRAADYIDKILKGAKPSELPMERPRKWNLVINLKTAKQIGLTIPPNVLARRTR